MGFGNDDIPEFVDDKGQGKFTGKEGAVGRGSDGDCDEDDDDDDELLGNDNGGDGNVDDDDNDDDDDDDLLGNDDVD